MTALDGLLARLRSAGLTIRADGGDLVLGGCTDALTPDLRRQLTAHKPALLAHLSSPCIWPECGRPVAGWRPCSDFEAFEEGCCAAGHPVYRRRQRP